MVYEPSWIPTYAVMGGDVKLIMTLLYYLTQHIFRQCSLNNATIQILMALKNPNCVPSQEVIKAYMDRICETTTSLVTMP